MHSLHSGYTLALPLKTKKVSDELIEILRKYNALLPNSSLNFRDCSTTFFASATVLPKCDDTYLPETFILATSFCGSMRQHLTEVVANCNAALHQIFQFCQGYNFEKQPEDDTLVTFLIRNRQQFQFFGSRLHLITKDDVTNEYRLRKAIDQFLNKTYKNDFSGLSGEALKQAIEEHLAKDARFRWVLLPTQFNIVEFLHKHKRTILSAGLGITYFAGLINTKSKKKYLGATLGIAALVAGTVLAAVKHMDEHKSKPIMKADHRSVQRVMSTQSHPVVNEMTAASPLKKGEVRRFFYSTILAILRLKKSVEIPTVSTIRWLAINDRKRLLFLSNFTNITDFYVRDFLAGDIPYGVNFLFGHGTDFPDPKGLVFGGMIDDPEGYMDAVHKHQYETHFWYAHEPNLSIDIILNNRKIRQGLFKKMDEKQALQWLKLL